MVRGTLLIISISLIVFCSSSSILNAVHCTQRGGCDCDCGWANSKTCAKDDGTCCFSCCCGNSPSPHKTYCPSANDLLVPYHSGSNIVLYNGGWSIHGGGAAATKASFNLLGGSVEWDIDFSQTNIGVNGNIYTISPTGISSGGFGPHNYCDGSKPAGSEWCVEVDWIESNGHCGGATTLHDVPGPGSNGCTAWGCGNSYHYNGRPSFHMKVTYDANGVWTTTRDGQIISPSSLHPTPTSSDWETLVHYYSTRGAVIYSSQWVGWVPVEDCGKSGDLSTSSFNVKNLRITGTVVQGPEPTTCS